MHLKLNLLRTLAKVTFATTSLTLLQRFCAITFKCSAALYSTYISLCIGLSCFIFFKIMRLNASHAQERIHFFPVLHPHSAYIFIWAMMFFVEQSIWNVWGLRLICQAQWWEEDLADNKLMKMSLTCTSISLFHMRSTEHINIGAGKHSLLTLHLNHPRSGLL